MARVSWRWQTCQMRCQSCVVLAVAGALALASTGLVSAATKSANPGQKFFRDALIKDTKTSGAIRDMLTSNAAIVDPTSPYADLTGDGKSDAIVRIHSAGAAGVIAVYVFSTDGNSKGTLRAVFRSQQLDSAVTDVTSGQDLVIDTPKYAAGDDVCCPAQLTHRVYAWSTKAKAFHRTTLTTVSA